MDTQIGPTTNIAPAMSVPTAQQPPPDTKVPVVQRLDKSATLPPEKPFVAQVVNARLSGTDYPENPGEIAPPERTLRPYDVPMLPADKSDSPTDAPQSPRNAGDVDPGPFGETD